MKSLLYFILPIYLFLASSQLRCQNETKKWYFGNKAGLDFITSPPTILTNGSMNTFEGCSSIADAAGSLLFYTDGITIWNQSHVPMANGTGLFGSNSTSQSGVIVKKPGSAGIYYVFTLASAFGDLFYSEVDMSLAAGAGSVTTKNSPVASTLTEHLTSVRHCNGVDIWVLAHRGNSTDFLAFLVTSAGISTVPVVSTIGAPFPTYYIGCMKFSPNGSRMGFAVSGNNAVELYDFNASTGVLSNSLSINGPVTYPYGVEFSPDGSRFYSKGHNFVGQWDLCAGSDSAIAASCTTFTTVLGIGSMQLAADGKIYAARLNQTMLGVVNNPNALGASCNYMDLGRSVSPKISQAGLPNFITSWFKSAPAPFSQSLTCNTVNFSSPVQPTINAGCQGLTYSVTGQFWNFGDPASGTANTSTLTNPIHTYFSNGTFTAELVLFYSCGGGTDTLRQTIIISGATPSLNVTGNFTMCAGEKRIYTVTGANTQTWSTNAQTSTISISPAATTAYTVIGTNTANACSAQKIFTVTVAKCTAMAELYAGEGTVKFYPNPINQVLEIENEARATISIVNQQSQVLLQKVVEPGENSIDLSTLSDGFYFLRVITGEGVATKRIVKVSE
jgi:hypothetical protein